MFKKCYSICFFYNYARIKIDSYNLLPPEKQITLHNIIILIKSVFNRNQNQYYFNISLEGFSFQSPKNNDNK